MRDVFLTGLRAAAVALALGYSASSLSAYYPDDCCGGEPCAYISGDVLAWSACQSGLDYAVSDNGRGVAGSAAVLDARSQRVEFGWQAGFRIHASYRLPCDCWSLEATYTHWNIANDDHADAPLGGILHAVQYPNNIAGGRFASSARSHVRLNYNTLDILLAKTFQCADSCFAFRPYGGARILWFRENVRTDYSGLNFAAVGDFAKWETNFTAAGAALGVRASYPICDGYHVIGHLCGAVLGSDPEFRHHWHLTPPFDANTNSDLKERNRECLVMGEWDASLGIAYDWCPCGWDIKLAAGYEIVDWWNAPRMGRFATIEPTRSDDNGRLTLHGAFFRAGVAF